MKLTEWYSGDQKPTSKGVYERRRSSGVTGYSYFEKGYWSFMFDIPKAAEELRSCDSPYQDLPWRGIKK